MAIDSMKANRALEVSTLSLNNTFQKAASGKRINKASDDAAGLAIAMSLQNLEVELGQGTRNAYDAQSVINVAQGAYNSLGEIATRQAELATQAANGIYNDAQRANINQEAQALAEEAQRIQATTQFNGMNVMSGQFQAQVGTDSSPNSQISVASQAPGVVSVDLSSAASARASLDSISNYSASLSQAQGNLGAAYSRLDTAIQNNNVSKENFTAARARIEDADMGEVAANLTKYSTQQKIGVQVLQQTMQSDSMKLNLLKKA
ncbi:MAG: flagellin FliC [SAR324 cluster bacterium]|uniref:Flagellin n=1 Tax=SAR324 cluster bacterium TaxID=2024889 RepID=A0A7X9FS45_9DELT|nr:flagellin FliC [SAR324 cluster bacterium]